MANRKDPQGRVLKPGEIYRKDGMYLYRWQNEYGEREQISAKTLVSLRERERHIQRDLLDGIRTHEAMKVTLNQLFESFIKRKSKEVRATTVMNYRTNWDSCVRHTIGDLPIAKIKTSTLDDLFAELSEEGRAKSVINQGRKLIKTCLDKGVADDLIRKNPADYVGKITGTVKKVEALTAEQQEALLEFAEESAYFIQVPLLIFALETGLRCGELTALQWSDIDSEYIHVTKQLQELPDEGGKRRKHIVEHPKSDAGRRDIPLNPAIRHALTEQRKLYMQLGIRCTQTVDGYSDFVFLTVDGKPRNHNNIFNFLKRLIDAYNKREEDAAKQEKREPQLLPKISAHVLRHSAITNWANSGEMSLKTLQALAGHAHPHLTLDVYADSDKNKVAEEFARFSKARAAL